MRGWIVEDGAVFGDDPVEDSRFRKDIEQVGQFAAGHEEKFSAGLFELGESFQSGRFDRAMSGDGAVVVGGERKVLHRQLSAEFFEGADGSAHHAGGVLEFGDFDLNGFGDFGHEVFAQAAFEFGAHKFGHLLGQAAAEDD